MDQSSQIWIYCSVILKGSQRVKYSWGDTNPIGRRISYILARNEIQAPQAGISNTFQTRKVVKGVVLSKYKIWFVCSWFFWMKKCDHKAMKLYIKKKKKVICPVTFVGTP